MSVYLSFMVKNLVPENGGRDSTALLISLKRLLASGPTIFGTTRESLVEPLAERLRVELRVRISLQQLNGKIFQTHCETDNVPFSASLEYLNLKT